MIYLFVGIILLIILIATLPMYDTSRNILMENFSSDEAVQNISSLYNQNNLTVSQITTPKLIGQPNLAIMGNVTIPGKITSPTLDTINTNLTNQINAINAKIDNLKASTNNIAKCNWTGPKVICGDCSGEEDDVWINCQNGQVTGFKFGKSSNIPNSQLKIAFDQMPTF
mgnify:CR=1 FL=1